MKLSQHVANKCIGLSTSIQHALHYCRLRTRHGSGHGLILVDADRALEPNEWACGILTRQHCEQHAMEPSSAIAGRLQAGRGGIPASALGAGRARPACSSRPRRGAGSRCCTRAASGCPCSTGRRPPTPAAPAGPTPSAPGAASPGSARTCLEIKLRGANRYVVPSTLSELARYIYIINRLPC